MKRFLSSCARLPRVVISIGVAALLASLAVPARAITIDMVTVGDPGNTADTDPSGFGAVADTFQIMKYEFTNQQYTEFLNSVAATDTYSLYNSNMGSQGRGGITQSGSSGSYTYAVRTDMGDKPANYVNWFDVARVANWLMNGATSSASTETGAYTLVGGQTSGNTVARNANATYYLPTQDQWYKAAYYKGGGTDAGYWNYATQSDIAPTAVTATTVGTGTSGGVSPVTSGNFANFNERASWNGQTGNVTTVGSNGGASFYGAFDMTGNVTEWNDLTGAGNSLAGERGGNYRRSSVSSSSFDQNLSPGNWDDSRGFRLTSVAVPEPSTCAMALAGLACGGYSLFRRRRVR